METGGKEVENYEQGDEVCGGKESKESRIREKN
jgi:hypothetical protein